MGNETSFLFSNPSFVGGMARTLDIGATLNIYNESKTSEKADKKAIYNDWKAVGNDIRLSMNKYGEK